MHHFQAPLQIIGVNPYVSVPEAILAAIFEEAVKSKGHIPIHGTVNAKPYKQTLVKYAGEWRLYINMVMLKDSPRRIGETITVTVAYDPEERTIAMPPAFAKALQKDAPARKVFQSLSPSMQKEIVRYLANLKTEESLQRNITRALNFLKGKERFAGRDKP